MEYWGGPVRKLCQKLCTSKEKPRSWVAERKSAAADVSGSSLSTFPPAAEGGWAMALMPTSSGAKRMALFSGVRRTSSMKGSGVMWKPGAEGELHVAGPRPSVRHHSHPLGLEHGAVERDEDWARAVDLRILRRHPPTRSDLRECRRNEQSKTTSTHLPKGGKRLTGLCRTSSCFAMKPSSLRCGSAPSASAAGPFSELDATDGCGPKRILVTSSFDLARVLAQELHGRLHFGVVPRVQLHSGLLLHDSHNVVQRHGDAQLVLCRHLKTPPEPPERNTYSAIRRQTSASHAMRWDSQQK
eukprot:scaffold1798_cov248-Pinguiococcus_pyrenoidosus.AAC.7